jgi:hypothetical protein
MTLLRRRRKYLSLSFFLSFFLFLFISLSLFFLSSLQKLMNGAWLSIETLKVRKSCHWKWFTKKEKEVVTFKYRTNLKKKLKINFFWTWLIVHSIFPIAKCTSFLNLAQFVINSEHFSKFELIEVFEKFWIDEHTKHVFEIG